MKKEIKEQFNEYRNRETEAILEIMKDKDDETAKAQLQAIKQEASKWLESLSGTSESLAPGNKGDINRLIGLASREIEYAAKENAYLISYIRECTQNREKGWPGYYAITENMGQSAAIAEQSALAKIRKITNYTKKQNRKNFLNNIICKFKKSKLQESQNEKGSNEPING